MKANLSILFLIIAVFKLAGQKSEHVSQFPLGEKLVFKINYGWFTLGEASMSIEEDYIYQNKQPHYYSKIEAQTTGLFSWLAGINNEYWGYVDIANFRPSYSEKHLEERKGLWDQWNTFDYQNMITSVKINDFKEREKNFTVSLTNQTYDLHGTYLYLRSKLWSGYNVGDSLLLSTYWEDKLYDFGMEYGGTEKIKYDGEKVLTHKFYGLFPVTSTFPKEKAVTIWVMERNGMGIPLLIEADMKIGKVKLELKSYEIKGKPINLLN